MGLLPEVVMPDRKIPYASPRPHTLAAASGLLRAPEMKTAADGARSRKHRRTRARARAAPLRRTKRSPTTTHASHAGSARRSSGPSRPCLST